MSNISEMEIEETFTQETAITILAPALAIPLASDFDPTCPPAHINDKHYIT